MVISAYFVSWICQSHNSYLLGIHPISGLCVLIGQSKTLAYVCWAIHPISGSYICFSISGFYFWIRWNIIEHPPRYSWNIIEHPPRYSWNIIEHPPRYSWNIIDPSTSLQLEYYRAIHLVTVGILSSHPPRYNWNIFEPSTSLQLEYYQASTSL